MADVITPTTPALANFNFNDVAQGVSNVVFYGGNHVDTGGSDEVFSNSTFYSSWIVHKAYDERLDTYTEKLNVDFDLTFGAPRIVNGNVIVNVPMAMGDAHAGAETETVGVRGQFLLYHVTSGGTETELGDKTTEDYEQSLSDNAQAGIMYCEFFSVTNQKFRVGEKLRLTVKLFAKNENDRYKVWGIGCDPQNRNDVQGNGTAGGNPSQAWLCFPDNVDTNLIIQVPFKIDI
jgi:hypothetical protein